MPTEVKMIPASRIEKLQKPNPIYPTAHTFIANMWEYLPPGAKVKKIIK